MKVGSLPRHVSEIEVRGLIDKFLPIDSIEWMTDAVSGKALQVFIYPSVYYFSFLCPFIFLKGDFRGFCYIESGAEREEADKCLMCFLSFVFVLFNS